MKKIFIRIIGSVCILAAVLMLFMSTSVTVKDVSRNDMREYRNMITTDLQAVEDALIAEISRPYSEVKAELKDSELPATKSSIKKSINELETIFVEAVNFDISLKEVFEILRKAPRLIEDLDNLFSTSLSKQIVLKETGLTGLVEEDVQSAIEIGNDYKGAMVAVVIFIVLFAILGLAAATTHSLNKVRWLKYIVIVLLILVVVGISVGVPVLNDLIQNEFEPEVGFEDMTLRVTAMPYICVVLAIVPVVLDIIFEKNKIKKEK